MSLARFTSGQFSNKGLAALAQNFAPSRFAGYLRSSSLYPLFLIVCVLALSAACPAQQPLPATPADGISLYHQLRNVGLDATRIYKIRDAEFDREDLHIALKEGTIAFTEPVAGHITGAFFMGDGEVLLVPPDQAERTSLALFTKAAVLEENFQSAYFRFADDRLFKDLEPAFRPAEEGNAFLQQWNSLAKTLADPDALRLLLAFTNTPDPKDHFLHARISGQNRGTFDVIFDTELQEQLATGQISYRQGGAYYDVWTSFPMRSRRRSENAVSSEPADQVRSKRISKFRIKVRVRPPDSLDGEAHLSLAAGKPGQQTLLFELSRNLKVSSITSDGKPVQFLQNEALAGTELARRGNDVIAVLFPQPLPVGKVVEVDFAYSGSVLSDAGGGLLRVGARGTWYPNFGLEMSDFDLEFHYPPAWTLLATGKQKSLETINNEQVAHWTTERPIPVAGFNLGHYVSERAQAGAVAVESHASLGIENSFPVRRTVMAPPALPQFSPRVRNPAPPPLAIAPPPTPANLAGKVAQTSAQTIEFLGSRIGPFPYNSLQLTQIPGNLSQGWPGLVFLSSSAFVPERERPNSMNGEFDRVLFNRLMVAHETAHQWWGDAVMWSTYRDQWISEALANYCAMLSMEAEQRADFRTVLNFYRKQLTEKNADGEENRQAGPVTLGQRLNSSHFPEGYEVIAYGRGTWLIHMLREMLRDAGRSETAPVARATRARSSGPSDDLFYSVLRQLQTRFANKSVSTRDLQQALEEVLPRSLYFENHKSLDWFFEGWVNGTALPTYQLQDVKIMPRAGKFAASATLLQKNAPDSLITPVPIYAAMPDGSMRFLARVFADGPETTVKLMVPAGTKKLVIDPEQTLLTHP
jgi:hypothetical protein